MKINTLLLTTLSVLPAFAIAQAGQFNFYGKAGIDLTSRFESVEIATIKSPFFNSTIPSKKNTFSPSIFLETTYNILPQTEIGVGMGYIKRKGFNHETSKVYMNGNNKSVATEKAKINRYSSIPIYLILKQNYPLNQDTALYLKGNLGYSLNKARNTTYTFSLDNNPYSHPVNVKTKNGLYLGLGAGVEYKSFLAEIGYYHTDSAIKYKFPHDNHNLYESYNNDALRFSIGFKF
ncbi:outer membrane beta-barrel protein [Pasteurella oralis]|uniref:outer membrane beta-barrel protein n=1 Tax=Pasteurella oralis TaxID=1071947 RepID=UPI000C7E85AF|nr:outer membrane beta-barrel protein [Pasteurella oralis]